MTSGVNWSVNSTAASISTGGVLAAGDVTSDKSVTVTAGYNGKSASQSVTVKDTPKTLTSIAISGPLQVDENSSAQYTCTAAYSDGSGKILTSGVNWSVNNTAASISTGGVLTAGKIDASVDVIVTASFNGLSDNLNLKINDSNQTYTLTIDIAGSGSVSLDPPGGTYGKGTVVTLTAAPDPGWTFDGWVGEVADYDSLVTSVKMDADVNLSVTFVEDTDQDGVPDREESGPDSDDFSFDGNHDGIADYLQGNVVSIHSYDHSRFFTLSVPEPGYFTSCRTQSADALDPALPAGTLQLGIVSIEIKGLDPGAGSVLTFHLPADQGNNTYLRYGATEEQADPDWHEFMYEDASQTGATFKDDTLSVYLKDGRRGDDDLRENGVISTTGGPVLISNDNDSDDSDDSLPIDIDLGNGVATDGGRNRVSCFIDSLFN